MTRREALKGLSAAVMSASAARAWAANYQPADTSWLAACRFGISTHWTARSMPVGADDWLPFSEAVRHFDVDKYVSEIADAGAQYIIFTSAHALQMLPAPCDAIDHILPGRTTKRDLIGEIADACHKRGLRFIQYYNHSCNRGDDPEWEYAVGYHDRDKQRLAKNLCNIVAEMGARYGKRVDAWWFDSCYSLDDRGLYSSVSTDLHGWHFPWDEFVGAAKTGNSNRLVALSPGVMVHYMYSTHQDYEAGEANQLIAVPTSQYTQEHLQGHRWVCLDNTDWVHQQVKQQLVSPHYKLPQIVDYVRSCNHVQVPVTFNVDIDRNATLSPGSLAMLQQMNEELKHSG
jgi:hypothetical protein